MKISRREAVTFLLGGLAALGGSSSVSEKPSLPERCKRHHEPKSVPPWDLISYKWELVYDQQGTDMGYSEWVRTHRSDSFWSVL